MFVLFSKKLFLRSCCFKYSTSSTNFTLQYLINTCGLSPKAAISASQKLHFDTPNRPDSVLNLFSTYGFTDSQISTLITKRPRLLLSDPHKTLKPKIDYLISIGFSDIATFLSNCPNILLTSLNRQIIPTFDFIRQFLHTNNDVSTCFKRSTWMIESSTRHMMEKNINILRENGVPESRIVFLLKRPRSLGRPSIQFNENVSQIKEMGFDPSSHSFVDAIFRFSSLKKSCWEPKFEVYRRWGWSDDDILSAFKRDPAIIVRSEKKINQVMDFVVNKMGWDSLHILNYPAVFAFSLEKRIIPRLSVIKVLISECLLSKKKVTLSTVLVMGETQFLAKFVNKHKGHLPGLLNVYLKNGVNDVLTG